MLASIRYFSCALIHSSSISACLDVLLTHRFHLRPTDSNNRCARSKSCSEHVDWRCCRAMALSFAARCISDIENCCSNNSCRTLAGMLSSDFTHRRDRISSYFLISMESKAWKSQPRETAVPEETEGLISGIWEYSLTVRVWKETDLLTVESWCCARQDFSELVDGWMRWWSGNEKDGVLPVVVTEVVEGSDRRLRRWGKKNLGSLGNDWTTSGMLILLYTFMFLWLENR